MEDRLLEGIVRFQNEEFEQHRALFTKLKSQQMPHTLFIGCADSRVVPNMITNTLPGELFVVRNIANIVPPYRISAEYAATTSAIEYAVEILGVKSIVVCGHSNCGGCSALYLPAERLNSIPNVKKWLELAQSVKQKVTEEFPDAEDAKIEWLTEQINVVEQLKHLLSYPFIREKYENGEISIYGWYYVIETGEVYIYNKKNGLFEKVGG